MIVYLIYTKLSLLCTIRKMNNAVWAVGIRLSNDYNLSEVERRAAFEERVFKKCVIQYLKVVCTKVLFHTKIICQIRGK